MLYIRLNMAADDDGFCDNPRSIMRACGASDDSMKLLVTKKFVLTFSKQDNFVVVIKHWRMNNYIRKDTYHETKYKEFMRELYYDENNSYSLNPGDGHKPCLPEARNESETDPSRTRDDPLTQVRLDKDRVRLGEERLDKDNNISSIYLSNSAEKSERESELHKTVEAALKRIDARVKEQRLEEQQREREEAGD